MLLPRVTESWHERPDSGYKALEIGDLSEPHPHRRPAGSGYQRCNVRSVTTDQLRPLVMDFGLALRDEAEITMTLNAVLVDPESGGGRGATASAA